MQELRDYQAEAISKLRERFLLGRKKVVLQLPTGSGKTTIAAEMIRKAITRGRRCLFVADQLELIDQASERFDLEGIPHGIIQGMHPRTDPDAPLQVCSIQTLNRRKIPQFDFCVIDECHVLHKAHLRLMETDAAFVGLSATPFAKGMGKAFDDLVVGATTKQLIEQGYLVEPKVWAPSEPDLTSVRTIAGDYDEAQLADVTNRADLIGDIVSHWKRLCYGRPTLVGAVNIAHSLHIVQQFRAEGINAVHLDAYTDKKERRDAISRLKSGEVQLISSVQLFIKGFDFPGASALIMARPTKSLILHIQFCGRVLRIAEGKTDAIILDHAGNTARHGFVTDPLPTTLDTGKKAESKKAEKKPMPRKCSKCSYMKPPKVHACPSCGFKAERQSDVEVEAGELVQIRVRRRDKQSVYSQLLYIALERGYKTGWAANQYRKKFGRWPRGLSDHCIEPTPEIASWVKSQQIRYAKRRVA